MAFSSRVVVVVAAIVVLGACAPTRHVVRFAEESDRVVIRNVTVIDGTGAPPVVGQDVVVVAGRIESILPAGSPVDPLRPTRVVDGTGQTLLPGFVDAHVHVLAGGGPRGGPGLSPEEHLERLVRVGVTTAFDLSASADEARTLDDRVKEGSLPGPRLRHTHFVITAKDGYPLSVLPELSPTPAWLARLALPQVATVDDIDRVLDDVDDAGVDFVKIMMDRVPDDEPILDASLARELIGRARRRGHPVIVHAGHVDDAVVAASAGATMLAHLPRRGRFSAAQVQALKQSGVMVIATAAMWDATDDLLGGRFTPSPLDRALVPGEVLDAVAGVVPSPPLQTLGAQLAAARADRAANLRDLIAAGVPVVVGTDSPLPGTWAGSSYARELQALLAAGLAPMDLIVAMTSRPAAALGGGFGVMQPGAVADLVLVDGDPLADPTRLFSPARVFVAGREVEGLAPLPTPLPAATASSSVPTTP